MATPAPPTNCWRMFYELWNIEIPEVFCVSKAQLEQFGVPTSGDRAVDRTLAMERRGMYASIVSIALYLDEGAPITFVNRKDTVEMYKILKTHLEGWKWVVETQMNAPPPPIDDLQKLDKLASAIFPIASGYVDMGRPIGGLASRLESIAQRRIGADGQTLYVRPDAAQIKAVEPPKAPTMHSPIADAIARRAFKRG
jgi:hypothetical protein